MRRLVGGSVDADRGSNQRRRVGKPSADALRASDSFSQPSLTASSPTNEPLPNPEKPSKKAGPRKGKERRPAGKTRRQSSRPTAETVGSGADLERRVGRIEFAEGALVRLRVPVRADEDPGRDVLTDIDVLSLDVDSRLRLHRSVLECKSGQGQAGEPALLFELAGFRTFVGAERAVLVRLSASRRGMALARKLGVHLLDGATLAAREQAHAWIPDAFGHLDGEACRAAEVRTDTQFRAFGEMPASLISFLRHDALLAESHRVLGALVAVDSAVQSMGVLPDPAGVILAGHALTALIVAALQDAAQAETLPNAELRKRLELAITTGNPDDEHILEVLEQADELFRHHVEQIHRGYVDQGAPRINFDLPSLRALVAEPPPWIERYMDLVTRLRGNPAIARDLGQTTELACFEALVGGTAWKASAFDHLFTPEHRNLLLVAVGMLREVSGAQVADRLATLASLPFDRHAPSLPDRRSTEKNAGASKPAVLAKDLPPSV
jgi:hypothetical protein